jgi:hypothetical protein
VIEKQLTNIRTQPINASESKEITGNQYAHQDDISLMAHDGKDCVNFK